MKLRRYKHARRVLSFYYHNFGLHEPYQVLVDGTFCQAALKGKIQLKEQLPKYLGGTVQLVNTKCVISELLSLGEQLKGALFVAKRFQQRKCAHPSTETKSATDCVLSLVGKDNPHNYILATQDRELRKALKKVSGTPFLHIVRNTIVLENPSKTSHEAVHKINVAKLGPERLSKLVMSKHRTQRPRKGPNPLAVKRKRNILTTDKVVLPGMITRSKKRRLRIQRKRTMELSQ